MRLPTQGELFLIILLCIAVGAVGGYLAAVYRMRKGKKLLPWDKTPGTLLTP